MAARGGNINNNPLSSSSSLSDFTSSEKRKRQRSSIGTGVGVDGECQKVVMTTDAVALDGADGHQGGIDAVGADARVRSKHGSDESGSRKKDKKKKKDKQKKKKRHRSETLDTNCSSDRAPNEDGDNHDNDDSSTMRKKKEKKQKKRKRKLENNDESRSDDGDDCNNVLRQTHRQQLEQPQHQNQQERHHQQKKKEQQCTKTTKHKFFPFEYEHILAPMVGASELAFRLLCRKYGATLCYTPMMSAKQFCDEADRIIDSNKTITNAAPSSTTASTTAKIIASSNICEFQTIPQDRPLVVHFSANNPTHFASAARHVEHLCDAIDLNLGCPQRTAYLGHFGSYLLDACDRQLVLDIVRAGASAVSIPIFVKIRLLDKVEDTIRLCQELRGAGASLIAIHARYRASWERTGAGARDGPAMLDQVALIKRSMPDFPIISNGNVITYEDVVANRKFTGANGIMSAEGMLDNPALYLPRFGNVKDDDDADSEDIDVHLPIYSPLNGNLGKCSSEGDKSTEKAIRKLQKKLREVEAIEKKVKESGMESINDDQRCKLHAKSKTQTELQNIESAKGAKHSIDGAFANDAIQQTKSVELSDLMKAVDNKIALAREYLSLVRLYPTKIRSVVFHVRRMCKVTLEQYQLMEECIASTTVDEVEMVLTKCDQYIQHPDTFHFDREKAARDMEALAAKQREEGKRKAYEERMTRKAKREGLSDLGYYLRIGAEVPTVDIITRLKSVSKEVRVAVWKKDHSQHCMSFHFDDGGCKRDRACAFLHVEANDGNEFVADDEVAG